MVATSAIASRFAFKYVGNPTGAAAKMKALAYNGPLLIAADHALAALLPDALDTVANAPWLTIDMRDMLYMTVGGLLFAPEVAQAGMHMAVDPVRLAALIQDLSDSGCEWAPRRRRCRRR